MGMYEVHLLATGIDASDDAQMDRLYGKLDGVTVEDRAELALVTMWLEAPNADEAVTDAIASVESAVPSTTVRQLDADLVAALDIAERLDRSKESIRLWSTGARGPGGFPAPVGIVGGVNATRVWAWSDVFWWLAQHQPELLDGMPLPVPTPLVALRNAMLMNKQITGAQRMQAASNRQELAVAAEQPGAHTPLAD